MPYLVRVDAPRPSACFGFEVAGDVVTRAAPIARWMVGQPAAAMVDYWRRRGAVVTCEACP